MQPENFGTDKLFWRIRDAVIIAEARSQRIVLWNPTATKIFGYSASEALKLRIEVLVPEHLKAQHRAGITRYAETGRGPYIDSQVSLELPALRKSGEEIYVELSLSPIEAVDDADGDARFVLAIIRDITERKRAGEALRQNEERFRSLIQNASDVITILEPDGTIRYESPSVERVLGYHPEERVGKNGFDYIHPDDKEQVESTFAEALDKPGEVQRPVVFRLRHKGGTWRHMETIRTNLLDDPAVKGIVSNSRDITERKQSEEKLQRSLDALLTTHEAGQVFGSTLNEDEIGRRLLEMVWHVAALEAAVIYLRYGQQEERLWHAVGAERLWRPAHDSPETQAARSEALMTGEHQLFEVPHPDPGRGRLVGWCVPLQRREQVIGMLEAYGLEALREQATVELLGSLANQAVSALENARLYGELGKRERRLQELVAKLMAAQEEERRRVAYEVHDGLAQVAMGAHQQLQAYVYDPHPDSAKARRRLDRGLELVEQTTEEAQRVIADLRPTTLDDLGLTAAVRSQAEELRAEGWEVYYDDALGEERLPAEIETALYRVAHEALWNVRKHAGITEVVIALDRRGEEVRLEVRDFGRGFDPSAVSEGGGPAERVGLSSMRERIALLGGDFEIRSRPGEGTSMVAEVPLPTSNRGDTGHAG
jgi:PAS domain S-box-containing protein